MTDIKKLAGTKTAELLVASYVSETQAYARYTYAAQAADKEGYYPIGQIFRMTAANELHHAKVFLKFLNNVNLENVQIHGQVDAGFLGNTVTNLQIAIHEESVDGYLFYTAAAKTAAEEGFDVIASHFTAIASVEKRHHDRFELLLKQVQDGTVWKRPEPIKWQCMVCGYEAEGTEPPKVCPGCDHPYQHYMPTDIDMC